MYARCSINQNLSIFLDTPEGGTMVIKDKEYIKTLCEMNEKGILIPILEDGIVAFENIWHEHQKQE
jgi:hypothetical protein